jgi:hypothetical protein
MARQRGLSTATGRHSGSSDHEERDRRSGFGTAVWQVPSVARPDFREAAHLQCPSGRGSKDVSEAPPGTPALAP